MDRCDAWGNIELEDTRLDGAICPYTLKFEGHELSLHWLMEFNAEWPPLSADLFVIGVTGDEVRFFSRPKKGFPFDEKGSGIDLGLLHQFPFLHVIQHDYTLLALRKRELLGLIDSHLEDPHH